MALLIWLLEPVIEHQLKDVRNVLADLRSGSEVAWAVGESVERLLACLELVCKLRAKSKE